MIMLVITSPKSINRFFYIKAIHPLTFLSVFVQFSFSRNLRRNHSSVNPQMNER